MDGQEMTLNPAQTSILEYIRSEIATNGCPPTRAEIAEHMGYKSPNAAQEHLKALEKLGAIRLIYGVSRGIRLVRHG